MSEEDSKEVIRLLSKICTLLESIQSNPNPLVGGASATKAPEQSTPQKGWVGCSTTLPVGLTPTDTAFEKNWKLMGEILVPGGGKENLWSFLRKENQS